MEGPSGAGFDLELEERMALAQAEAWGEELEAPFAFSNVSYVAPTKSGAVLKVPWGGDDESLHEADALQVWNGDGAVRLLRRSGRTLLEERAVPGDDLSTLPDSEATLIAVDLALRLWRPAAAPFRPVLPQVSKWLDQAEGDGSPLVPLARELLAQIHGGAGWLVHGDFHHHNILRQGDEYVAIDPKPYLADREYDVAPFLWNPIHHDMSDAVQTESRIRSFVAAGLDEFRIRAWTVIRGSYLRTSPDLVAVLKSLVA